MRARHDCAASARSTTHRMSFTAADLHAAMSVHLPEAATGLVVALSGGPDSAALLSGVAANSGRLGHKLRAVHVDHGLQAVAEGFRNACRQQCERLQVPLVILEAQVIPGAGQSVEAAARDARYAALAAELSAGECLLTAHHALDQAETLLL